MLQIINNYITVDRISIYKNNTKGTVIVTTLFLYNLSITNMANTTNKHKITWEVNPL